MNCGDTFLMPLRKYGVKAHLWIVVTEPEANGKCIIVNVTTLRHSWQDNTVVLQKGDHSFIQGPTFVRFSDAQFANVNRLLEIVECGSARAKQPCSAPVLRRVQDGLLTSTSTQNDVREYCERIWGRR